MVCYAAPTELRTDKGGEYPSTAFRSYCKTMGIHQEMTVPGTPKQNKVAERFNIVSVEMTRCLLLEGTRQATPGHGHGNCCLPPQPMSKKQQRWTIVEVPPAMTQSGREIRVPTRYGLAYPHAAEAIYPGEPGSYREAMTSPEKDKWYAENQDEVNSFNDNLSWTLVDRPKNRKVIPGRWVYKIKTNEQGNTDKVKARYGAKGFMQGPGLDIHETYARTCKPETLRTLFALAAQWGLQLHQ